MELLPAWSTNHCVNGAKASSLNANFSRGGGGGGGGGTRKMKVGKKTEVV